MQRHLAFAEPGPYFAAALVVLLDRQRFFQELDMRLLQSLSVRVDRDRSRLQLRPDPFAQVAQEFAAGVAALTRVVIGRGSCRERVCQSVSVPVVADSLQKKDKRTT